MTQIAFGMSGAQIPMCTRFGDCDSTNTLGQFLRAYGKMSLMSNMMTYDDFKAKRRFREIDGLRGLAIVFVLIGHMHDQIWEPFVHTGVPLFFVNSGFLITLLLVREAERRGSIDWSGFYIKRAWRLIPVYLFALALFSVLVVAGLAENSGSWWHRMVYFLTMNNEFAAGATFGHTWTLAVQEKFYIVWPLIGFAVLAPAFVTARYWATTTIAAILIAAWAVWPENYFSMYIPLMLGCVLALAFTHRRSFRYLSVLAHPVAALAILAIAVAIKLGVDTDAKVPVLFCLDLPLLFPALLLNAGRMSRAFTSRLITFIGVRAYSIYLLHPLVLSAVDLVIPDGQDALLPQLVRLALVVSGSVAFATVTYRFLEKPTLEYGQKVAARRQERGVAAAQFPSRAGAGKT